MIYSTNWNPPLPIVKKDISTDKLEDSPTVNDFINNIISKTEIDLASILTQAQFNVLKKNVNKLSYDKYGKIPFPKLTSDKNNNFDIDDELPF